MMRFNGELQELATWLGLTPGEFWVLGLCGLLFLVLVILWLCHEAPDEPLMVCRACGTVAPAKVVRCGSETFTFILCLLFLLPGIIFYLWRKHTTQRVCSCCGNSGLIPLTSPLGWELGKKLDAGMAAKRAGFDRKNPFA